MNEIDYRDEFKYLQRILKNSLQDLSACQSRETVLLILFALKKLMDDGQSLYDIEYLYECV